MNIHDLVDDARWLLHWQMAAGERSVLQVMLQRAAPALSVEVGTYEGGSLQVMSEYSGEVISLDIDPGVEAALAGHFRNVTFWIGDSGSLLPKLVSELNSAGRNVGFVLIDGDHSAEGVRRDIESVLRLAVRERLVILMHDSFNPDCRRGMLAANWAGNPHVHMVEIDFVSGSFHKEAIDTAQERSMWGGFACAVLEPEPRTHELVVGQRQRALYDAVYPLSVHATGPGKTVGERTARRMWRAAKRMLPPRAMP